MNLEGEGIVGTNQVLTEDDVILDIFIRKYWLTGGDAPDQWDRDDLAEFGLELIDIDHFDGARFGWIPTDVALAFEGVEMVLHRRARGQADRLADLADGWGIAPNLLSEP
jgi:hypothetical protein